MGVKTRSSSSPGARTTLPAALFSVEVVPTSSTRLRGPSMMPSASWSPRSRTTWESVAVEAFARALRQLPHIIADNAGYDSSELVTNLRAAIVNGQEDAGLNMFGGSVASMKELGVTECLRVKEQALVSATEAAEMILRVDDIVRCAPRQRQE